MLKKMGLLTMVIALLLAVQVGVGAAAELVLNGGFETGDFSGWTQGVITGFTGVTNGTTLPFVLADVHSGTYAAYLGPMGSDGTLTQTLPTIAGQLYTVSFWLANDGGIPNDFTATFDGSNIFSLGNLSSLPYVHFSFTHVASSNTTPLSFTFRNDPSFFFLDDVSVQAVTSAVPLPSALLLFGPGLAGLALFRKRFSL